MAGWIQLIQKTLIGFIYCGFESIGLVDAYISVTM
jgi:hypothetical protein